VQDLDLTFPDQAWVCDITYSRLFHGFIFLAVVIDVVTRSIRGFILTCMMDGSLTLEAPLQGIQDRVPEIYHCYQGIQYAASDYINALHARQVQISMPA
jgi:transposase InsO family protein